MKNNQPVRRSSRITRRNEEKPSSVAGHSKSHSPDKSMTSIGRKRRASSIIDVNPKIVKKTVEGRDIDGYCWICHKVGQDLICNSCPRVYHFDCTKKSSLKFNTLGSCAECQAQSVNGNKDHSRISRSSLKELLSYAMQEALRDKSSSKNQAQTIDNNKFCKYFKSWPDVNNSDLCQIIDLTILIDKMNDDDPPYLTTAEFFSDVKWIYHNCYILHGSDSEITKTALKLEKNFKEELLDIEACAECYFIKHSDHYVHADFFSKVCKEPHDIVWAKIKGSPYWPAKCLRIYNGHADVRFFGTHNKSTVKIHSKDPQRNPCYRISKKSPNDNEIKRSDYLESISELSVYVSNYQTIYETFPYHPVKTSLEDKDSVSVQKRGRGRRRRKTGGNQSELMETSFEMKETNNSFDETNMTEESENHKDVILPKVKMAPETSTIAASQSNLDFPTDEESYNERAIPATAESNVSDSIAVCMTFSAEEEVGSSNEMKSRPQLIGISASNSLDSESFSKPVLNCSSNKISNPNISSHADITLPNKLEIFTEAAKSYPADQSNMLPVITSTVSTSKDFSQEEVVSFTSEDNMSHASDAVSIIVGEPASTSSFPNAESQTAIHPMITNETCDSINEDDDIVILKELPQVSKAESTIKNNPHLEQALCQIITSNKPPVRELYHMCQEFTRKAFLKVWLSTNVKRQGDSEVDKFFQLYSAISNEKDDLKKENIEFKQENVALKKQKIELEEELRRLKENPALTHENAKSTQEILCSALLDHVDSVSKIDFTAVQREILKMELKSSYENQIKELDKSWKKKVNKILKFYKEKCEKLENPINDNTNINTKLTPNINLETSSLDLSKNAMHHEKEAYSAQMLPTDGKNIKTDFKSSLNDKNIETPLESSMKDNQTDLKHSMDDKRVSTNLAKRPRDTMHLEKKVHGIKEKILKEAQETLTGPIPDLQTDCSSETSLSLHQQRLMNISIEYSTEESVSLSDGLKPNVVPMYDGQIYMPDYSLISQPFTCQPAFHMLASPSYLQTFAAPSYAVPPPSRPVISSSSSRTASNSRTSSSASHSRTASSSSDSRSSATSSSDNKPKSKFRKASQNKK